MRNTCQNNEFSRLHLAKGKPFARFFDFAGTRRSCRVLVFMCLIGYSLVTHADNLNPLFSDLKGIIVVEYRPDQSLIRIAPGQFRLDHPIDPAQGTAALIRAGDTIAVNTLVSLIAAPEDVKILSQRLEQHFRRPFTVQQVQPAEYSLTIGNGVRTLFTRPLAGGSCERFPLLVTDHLPETGQSLILALQAELRFPALTTGKRRRLHSFSTSSHQTTSVVGSASENTQSACLTTETTSSAQNQASTTYSLVATYSWTIPAALLGK